ncbi:DUF305 domain-containing protein [Actinomadura viridis]|uniref:Uncharacterized protein (DUF305 family) n=1 Tax=Actinomadura viridis TaxID=58110 RepID=A0A931DBK2_9ACTN|nr:DUF305 domain-containing protein [Actinomadura viridis]MBG6088064.1 uncharacterized protein (DUF305 family) [Actinomadura viridis]
MRQRIALVAMTSALVAGVLGGCSGGEEPEKAAPKSTMLVPGKPGEPNKTAMMASEPAKPPVAAEVRFVEMMIPHHRQALEMAVLAPERASGEQVKSLAERINLGQKVEISAMEAWLRRNAPKASGGQGGHGGHGGASAPATAGSHAGMPGMATPEQMERLKAARGTEFDRLFLTLMITHHQGALTMVKDAIDKGNDLFVQELVRDVRSSQQAEIDRMRALMPKD